MLTLILIDVQHSQKAVFNFEKGSNRQNYSSSGSLQSVKKTPLSEISDSLTIWKNPNAYGDPMLTTDLFV